MKLDLPTRFAQKVAASVDMYHSELYDGLKQQAVTTDPKELEAVQKWIDLHERLEHFQQMAVSCDFEDAMVSYHGIEISEDQESMLKMIHKSTVHWLIGAVTEQIINKIGSERITNKDFAQLAVLAFENLVSGGEQADQIINEVKGSLNINVTQDRAEIK